MAPTSSADQKTCNKPLLEDLLTVIVISSPTHTNPHTVLIERVLQSLCLVPELIPCRKLIVCDGYIVDNEERLKKGRVTKEAGENYEQYKINLKEKAHQNVEPFIKVEVHPLKERVGFGFGIRHGLSLVNTEYVMIVQHDRCFMKQFDLQGIIESMIDFPQMRCVNLPTSSTTNYYERMDSKFHKFQFLQGKEIFRNNLTFLPLCQFYDSTHIAHVRFYWDFIFPKHFVPKSGFIEDKMGQIQVRDIRENGFQAHAKYGTFLFGDGFDRIVQHLDGRDRLAHDEFEWETDPEGGYRRKIHNLIRNPKGPSSACDLDEHFTDALSFWNDCSE